MSAPATSCCVECRHSEGGTVGVCGCSIDRSCGACVTRTERRRLALEARGPEPKPDITEDEARALASEYLGYEPGEAHVRIVQAGLAPILLPR